MKIKANSGMNSGQPSTPPQKIQVNSSGEF